MGEDEVRFPSKDLLVGSDGLVEVPFSLQGATETDVRLGQVWINADGFAVRTNRLVRETLAQKRVAQVIMGHRQLPHVRLETDDLTVAGNRLVQPPVPRQGVTEVYTGSNPLRLEANRL